MAVTVRMQAVIPFATNLPTDVITNTLYFRDLSANTSVQVVADAVNPQVQAFYDGIYDVSIPNYLANPGDWTANYYSVGTPPPNYPYTLDLVAASKTMGAVAIPTEVSCVLSFQGDTSPGVAQASRRGRIYLGGIADQMMLGSASGPPALFPRFTVGWLDNVAAAAEALMNTAAFPWVVWSPTLGVATPVTNGWVDNTPDTQRRRGVEATFRTNFP